MNISSDEINKNVIEKNIEELIGEINYKQFLNKPYIKNLDYDQQILLAYFCSLKTKLKLLKKFAHETFNVNLPSYFSIFKEIEKYSH